MGSITDVKGILVGNFEDFENLTGCTVILAKDGVYAACDVRGGAPGTRETDLLNPENLVEKSTQFTLVVEAQWDLRVHRVYQDTLRKLGLVLKQALKSTDCKWCHNIRP